MNILSDEEFDRHMEDLRQRAGMSSADAAHSRLAAALDAVTNALQRFGSALEVAVEQWPELVYEDMLDAEYLED